MAKCEKCGFENKEGNNYCANCGAPLSQIPQKITSKLEAPSQTKIALGIVVAITIFSVIGAGIWWASIRSYPGMSQATFTIVIESDTEWSGAFGGLGGSSTHSGTGHSSFTVQSSICSACIQKQTEWGYLTVKILKNGQVVSQQSTSAAYGVVTVSASS